MPRQTESSDRELVATTIDGGAEACAIRFDLARRWCTELMPKTDHAQNGAIAPPGDHGGDLGLPDSADPGLYTPWRIKMLERRDCRCATSVLFKSIST